MIFPPISQVGWRRAWATVTDSSASVLHPRNGPPDAVMTSRSTTPGRLARDQLVDRRVLGVDRDDLGAGRLGQGHHQLAADDQRLLVGQREVDPLPQRGDRRPEPGRADQAVEDEVGIRLDDQADEARGPGEDLALRPRAGGLLGGVRHRSERSARPRGRAPARRASPTRTGLRGRRARARPRSARRHRSPGPRSTRSSRAGADVDRAPRKPATTRRHAPLPPRRRVSTGAASTPTRHTDRHLWDVRPATVARC